MKKHILALCSSIALLGPAVSTAAVVTLGADGTYLEQGMEPTLGDLFTITNTADSGYQISSIIIDTSTSFSSVFFDTTASAPGDGDSHPFAADAGLAAATGFNSVTGDSDGLQLLTLSFSDFDPGESFSFTIDLDDTASFVDGLDFDGSTLSATFSGALIDPTILTSDYIGTTTDATVSLSGTVSAVPVPAAIWLMGSGLLTLLGVGLGKKARKA